MCSGLILQGSKRSLMQCLLRVLGAELLRKDLTPIGLMGTDAFMPVPSGFYHLDLPNGGNGDLQHYHP